MTFPFPSRILTTGQAAWADKPNQIELHAGSRAPDPQTSAAAFIFSEGKILAVKVRARSWDIPGGHIEAGETTLEALHREVLEEAGLVLGTAPLECVGWTHLEVLTRKPEGYKYPYPHTYQVLYESHLLWPPVLTTSMPEEISEVRWLDQEEARDAFHDRDWWPLLQERWALLS